MTKRQFNIVLWSIGLALAGAVLLGRAYLVDYYRIPQNGMYPGLPASSVIFAFKRAYSSPSDVKRGDVIVFRRTVDGRPYNYIWRVVGLPGDTIATSGESLAVNGHAVKRDRLREDSDAIIYREEIGPASYEISIQRSPKDEPPDASLTVPADSFFVMGDNRFGAVDSRYLGPVPFDSIIGRKL